jgi:PAS domain S-box-containing protein
MSEPPATPSSSADTLRERAEAATRVTRTDIGRMAPEEIQRLVHELQVHQIELQMQNEELRHAQSELARSRDRFSELYDHAPVGYTTIDAGGKLLEANLTAAAMLGVGRGELVGGNFTRFVARDSQDAFYLHQLAVSESEGPQACELRLRLPDGGDFAARIESVRAAVPGAEAWQCRSVIVDITVRKLTEEKLRRLNDTLEQRVAEQTREVRLLGEAVSHLAEGIVITGDGLEWPGPRIVFVNRAMCRITGYTEEELIGRTPRLLQGPASDRSVLANMRADLAAGRSCEIQLTNYRKDGSSYPAEMFVTPIFDAAGKHSHYVAIHRDISRRKEAEDALTTLGRIIEESQNEIYIIDAATLKFLQVNRGGRENLGYTMEELRELTPLDLKPSFDRAGFEALVAPLLAGQMEKIDFESRHRRKDGSYYDVEIALQLADYRGTSCIVAIALDTTRRKELEQEVIRASEEERQRIAHDLHDDLGSLLTGLKLHIESVCCSLAVKLGEPFDGCELILDQVRAAITRTREIARGLRPVGTDPEDLMGCFHGMAERTELSTGIRCRFECPAPVLIGDPHVANHLFRIAQEAVNNAIKHSGGSSVVISLNETAAAIELSVTDDGKGFDRETEQGGLGRHIMNYRAEALKGSLRIAGTPSGGTRVACRVPCGPGVAGPA